MTVHAARTDASSHRNRSLRTLIDRSIHRFEYIYDFGDYWQHDVIIEEVRDGDAEIG